jgi:hypothetical protein
MLGIRVRQAIWAVLVLSAVFSRAQNITGTILGDVKDPTGAVVPGAEITLTNSATNQSAKTSTNMLGHYEAPYLKPGVYAVRAGAPGFKTAAREQVTLEVDRRLRLDFTLEVGDVSTSVEVAAQTTLIESETGALGQVVGERTIEEMPLQGRNVFDLVSLAAGVQENPLATGGVVSTGASTGANDAPTFVFSDFSINGGSMRTNEYLLDGVSIMLPENNNFALSPSPDSTQQFKVMTASYSPQFGRTGGGTVNVLTKGGSNKLHGTVYEFHRNHTLRANNFFANARGQERRAAAFNLFGASVGGPVRKNRTFFYGDYQGHREWGAMGGRVLTIPSAAERNGDFSQRLASNGQRVNIYNPYTTRTEGGRTVRDPFFGNVIPQSLFDPVTKKALTYLPLPNRPGEGPAKVNNWAYAPLNRVGSDQWSARIDHRFTDRHSLFGRVTRNTGTGKNSGPFGTMADPALGDNINHVINAVLNDTITLSPSRLLNLRYGFTRRFEGRVPLWAGKVNLTELGYPAYVAAAVQEQLFPSYSISGFSAFGTPGSDRIRRGNDIHTWVGEQTQIRGRHTLVYGADIRLYNQTPFQAGANPSGSYSFTQNYTQDPFAPGLTSGDGLATFLLGYGSGSVTSNPAFAIRNWYAGLFVNDDIRLGKLTLNLGLRWDYEQPRTERYDRFPMFDFAAPFPVRVPDLPDLRGTVRWAGRDGEPRGYLDPVYKDFGPRAGLAYRLGPRTAVRAGYGIFFLPRISSTNTSALGAAGSIMTTSWVASVDNGITLANPLSNPYPTGLLLPPTNEAEKLMLGENLRVNDRSDRAESYMQHWNLGLQHGLTGNWVLGASYAGSQGTRLPISWQFNQVNPIHLGLGTALSTTVPNPYYGLVRTGFGSNARIGRNQLLRPYPQYGNLQAFQHNAASAKYHSLLVQTEKRFSHGYNLMINYTVSKLIDNGSGRVFNYTAYEPPLQNAYDLRAERAVSPQDVSQRVVVSHTVRLPSRGNRFLKAWTLSGTFTWNTGFPLAPTSTGSNTYLYTGVTRPNNTGRSAKLEGRVQDRLLRYFDTSVFTVPPSFTLGNTGRTLPDVRSPQRWNYNLAASRTVRVWERVSLMIRGESFNLTNTPFFDLPGTQLGAGTLGIISTSRMERQLQLSMKLLF